MYKNILKTSVLFTLTIALLMSCEKKNEEVLTIEVVDPVVEILDCDNMLNITVQTPAGDIAFNTVSSAHLYKDSCEYIGTVSYLNYSYMVLSNQWMEAQVGDLFLTSTSDGFYGISFGIDSLPQNGDLLYSWDEEAQFVPGEIGDPTYITESMEVSFTEVSEIEGEYVRGIIGGYFRGWIYDPVTGAGEPIYYPVTGDFCVPLTYVCE